MTYPQVLENMEDWPIYKLHKNRKEFVKAIEALTLERLMQQPTKSLSNIIARTIYLERIRIKEDPWKVDPPNESLFWKRIRKKLVHQSLDHNEREARAVNEEILKQIIHRYAEEIVGTFRIPTFRFARRFLTVFFNRLLNTFAGRNWHRIWGSKYRLYDRLLVKGEVEKLRALTKKGTVIVVPTHFSNLDSILIGYILDAIVGMPSFFYGAGLNLYNTGYTAYFMNRLGAYRIDRRKKNSIYLETLKAMSNLAIQKGTNSLFFPGGTRSRSGALETKLKMGLMGTAVEAQRAMYQQGKEEKVFIVPLILNYHFVLEAKFLIEQHLKKVGKEQYIQSRDEFTSLRKHFRFISSLFSETNEIMLSVGKPMDVLGNFVEADGTSKDQYNRVIDVKEYFISKGKITQDLQREAEYTKILAEKIVESYHKDNIVLSSHLVAFAAFNILKQQNPQLDLFGILRLPVEDYYFPEDVLENVVRDLQKALLKMEKEGLVKLSEPIRGTTKGLIRDGLHHLGTYHAAKPLLLKNGQIVSESFKVLFYYHNRLENYNLQKAIHWRSEYEMVMEELIMHED